MSKAFVLKSNKTEKTDLFMILLLILFGGLWAQRSLFSLSFCFSKTLR
jgi:hypothetical protein